MSDDFRAPFSSSDSSFRSSLRSTASVTRTRTRPSASKATNQRNRRENVDDGSVVIKNRKAEAVENAKKVSIPTTKRTSRASLRNASKKDEKRIHISSKKEQTRSEEAPKPKIRTRSSARVASSAE